MVRDLAASMALTAFLLLGLGCAHPSVLAAGENPEKKGETSSSGPAVSSRPVDVKLRGEIVCLAEELQRLHGVRIPPVHEHLTGIRAEDGQLYTLLRTSTSGFLFSDPRFRGRRLILTGRAFPPSGLLEVTRVDWIRDGKVHEVYYWCEVCSIRTVDPGLCACCRGPVELREREEGGGRETIIPNVPNEKPR